MTTASALGACAGILAALALGDLARALPRRHARRRADGRAATWRPAVRRLLAKVPVLGPAPADLAARLAAAGAPGQLAVRDVMALKCVLAGVALAAALMLAAALPQRGRTLVLVTAPAAGFAAPDLVLARRARERARRIREEAPDVLDRMRLAAEAGATPARALAAAAGRGGGPLAAELRAACMASDLGAPREAALRRLAERCPLPEVAALTAALRRAELHGSPLAPALEALAAQARAERSRRVRTRAQHAAPKIQLVVALLLVPAALLLIAAGMLTTVAPP